MKRIKNIKEKVNLLVFAEAYCKDCAVVLSFLVRMSKINKNINIMILPRKENEDILKAYNHKQRIPTIINLDNKCKGIFSEFPKVVQEKIINNEDEKSIIVSEFRNGKYNKFVEDEILKILI